MHSRSGYEPSNYFPSILFWNGLLDTSYTIQIQAEGYWEGSISVYLKIRREGKKPLRTGAFAQYLPEHIKSENLGLVIDKIDNIIFIYNEKDPNRILAVVELTEELVYPSYGPPSLEGTYDLKVHDLLSRLKTLLKNNELVLWR